jgi:hypothetical protein
VYDRKRKSGEGDAVTGNGDASSEIIVKLIRIVQARMGRLILVTGREDIGGVGSKGTWDAWRPS